MVFEMDDKTVIGVGQPNTPIQTVQRQRASLSTDAESHGAVDHDVAVQHIIPSVTIRVDEEGVEELNWYGGQAYVGLKCAIFEPSTAKRHIAELKKKIDRKGRDKNKNHAFLIHDGGVDHNITHISVQIAYIAIFLDSNLDSLLAVRTPPYLSVLNPAERFMGCANLALYGLALCQDQLSPEENKITYKLLTKKQWREAESRETLKKPEDRIDIKALARKGIETALKTLSERFSALEYDGKKVIVDEAVGNDIVGSCLDILKRIDPNIDWKKKNLTRDEVMKSPRVKLFFENHVCVLTYSLQLRKCDFGCEFHDDICDKEEMEKMIWFPPPEVDPQNKDKYLDFTIQYAKVRSCDTKLIETCKPSAKTQLEKAQKKNAKNELKKPSFKYVNTKARAAVQCSECKKGRVLYSERVLKQEQKQTLEITLEVNGFQCGRLLFQKEHSLNQIIFQHHLNECAKPMTAVYFSCNKKCLWYKFICSVCFESCEIAVEKKIYKGLPRCKECQAADYQRK